MVGERSIANVVWMWGSRDPAEVFEEIHVENRYIADSGLVVRYVILSEALHCCIVRHDVCSLPSTQMLNE
jgi:hypothetical protein